LYLIDYDIVIISIVFLDFFIQRHNRLYPYSFSLYLCGQLNELIKVNIPLEMKIWWFRNGIYASNQKLFFCVHLIHQS